MKESQKVRQKEGGERRAGVKVPQYVGKGRQLL